MTQPLPFYDYFGIDHALGARVLDRALVRGGDYADLFFERRVSGSMAMEDGRLKDVSRSIDMGVGVRVLKGDATGYAYSEDLTVEGLLRAAEAAASIASGGGGTSAAPFQRVVGRELYDVDTLAVDADALTKHELLTRAHQAAAGYDARVGRVNVSMVDALREILVVTSDGRYATDRQPMLRFNVSVVAEDAESRQSGGSGGGGRVGLAYFETSSPESIAEEAARIAVLALGAVEAPAGQFPVVLGPGDSGILLHEAVGHGLEADFNRKKTSNYSDQVGQQVASPLCTIVDDGTLLNSRGSINIDDEGYAPQTNTLIEAGILRGYMHDRMSTGHFDVQPSGNGRRESFRSVPMPRMTNTYLLAGASDPEEIIASVDYGVYARAFSGGQVNISTGDFVFSITEGYLIEGGKITAPLKGVNLIGNGPDAMRKVSMVGTDFQLSDGRWTCGKDGQSVPVGVGIPTVKIDAMTVGGSRAG